MLADVLLSNLELTRFWSLTPCQCFPTPCGQSSSLGASSWGRRGGWAVHPAQGA